MFVFVKLFKKKIDIENFWISYCSNYRFRLENIFTKFLFYLFLLD